MIPSGYRPSAGRFLAIAVAMMWCQSSYTQAQDEKLRRSPAERNQERSPEQGWDPATPRRYYVVFPLRTAERAGEQIAHTLAEQYGGRIRWILPHGFHIVATLDVAERISRDERVLRVVEIPRDLDVAVPPDKFFRSPSPNPGVYTVNLADSPRQYNDTYVRELAGQILATYGGELGTVFIVGMPGFVLRSSEAVARAIAMDPRVLSVSEDTIVPGEELDIKPLPPGTQIPAPVSPPAGAPTGHCAGGRPS